MQEGMGEKEFCLNRSLMDAWEGEEKLGDSGEGVTERCDKDGAERRRDLRARVIAIGKCLVSGRA